MNYSSVEYVNLGEYYTTPPTQYECNDEFSMLGVFISAGLSVF